MKNPKKVIINLAMVLGVSILGALLATGVDFGGTRWVKFICYVIFFASIFSPSILFPNSSCSIVGRLRRRS